MADGRWPWIAVPPLPLLVVAEDGCIADANPRLLELTGYGAEELLDQPVEVLIPEHRHAEHPGLGEGLLAGPTARKMGGGRDTVVRTKGGAYIPVQLDLARLGTDHLVASVVDLRERERRSRAAERAHHDERLASLGKLAATVAHEINNPLAYVSANLSIASRHVASREPQILPGGITLAKTLDESQRGLSRIATLVRQLQHGSRDGGEAEPLAPVLLCEAVQIASAMVRGDLLRSAHYVEDFDESLPPIPARQSQLVQIATNLLVNATQALEGHEVSERIIRVSTHRHATHQELWVEDSGPGVPPSLRARVLEPFFTTKPAGVGTGLGLAVTNELVAAHRGRLRVETREGGGARFVVELPGSTAPALVAPTTPPAEVETERLRRILFIDDEAGLRDILPKLLRPHEVVSLDAASALERIVRANDLAFDAVLCDLMMPDVDGQALYEQIRDNAPSLLGRFIVCTGGVVGQRARNFLEVARPPVLEKPVSRAEILRAVEQVCTAEPVVLDTDLEHAESTRIAATLRAERRGFIPASLPPDEASRLSALHATGLLDTPAEERFDRITRIARQLFDVPIALVSLVDEDRQWFKSCQGLSTRETGRHVAFCSHAVLEDRHFVVEDTLQDDRFAGNPLVVGGPRIRFYAGQPLRGPGGHLVGTLCIIDRVPRPFPPPAQRMLRDLARIVENEMRVEAFGTTQRELVRSVGEAQRQALVDPLTFLWNRRAIDTLLAQEAEAAHVHGRSLALIMIDVDRFKDINDELGHDAGDTVLRDVAQRIREALRPTDVVGRYGGDEFVVVLPSADLEGATQIGERILRTVTREAVSLHGGAFETTVSIGVSAASGVQVVADVLLAGADEALYRAKREGRARCVATPLPAHPISQPICGAGGLAVGEVGSG